MKVLVISYEKDSFSLFSKLFANDPFFEITYANFLPNNLSFDAIFAEDSQDGFETINTPILLLKNSKKIENPNIFIQKDCSALQIRNTLKSMSVIQAPSPKELPAIVCSKNNLSFSSNRLFLELSYGKNFLSEIYQMLKSYDISVNLIKKIGFVLSEFVASSNLPKIIGVFEILKEKIKLLLPDFGAQVFSIGAFCDFFEKTNEGLLLVFNRFN